MCTVGHDYDLWSKMTFQNLVWRKPCTSVKMGGGAQGGIIMPFGKNFIFQNLH